MNKAKRLIGVGYFPKELPIEFTTTPLSRHYAEIEMAIQQSNIATAVTETFNLVRTGHAVRVLRIPNPAHFVRLATLIDGNWKKIKEVTSSSGLSISKPLFRPLKRERRSRATHLAPAQELPERRLLSTAGQRYVLQTDFTRFFPSIYTHSIPWAIYGKAWAKRNRNPALFGNALDKSVRDAQDGQTVGLPVGPDSSHILSEMIAARVDQAAFSRRTPSGFRYIDDYFLGFETEAAAMSALDRIADAARTYELELNYSKTSIRSVQDMRESLGVDMLRDFEFEDATILSRRECHRFFALAETLARTEENALKFAIQMLAPRSINAADWEILESYLLRAGTLSPNCLDLVAFMLYRHSQRGAPLNAQRITRYLSLIVLDGITYSRHSCVAWALWALKALGYQVPQPVTKRLTKTNNSIAALLTLDLEQRGLLAGTLDHAPWTSLLEPAELYGEHWLLVYESVRSGWLTAPTPILHNDAVFSVLAQYSVRFYDDQRLARLTAQLRAVPRSESRNYSYGPVQSFLLAIDPPIEPILSAEASQEAPSTQGAALESLVSADAQDATHTVPSTGDIVVPESGDEFEYIDELTDEDLDDDGDDAESESGRTTRPGTTKAAFAADGKFRPRTIITDGYEYYVWTDFAERLLAFRS